MPGARSTVTPPSRLSGIVAIKTRSHFGNYEIQRLFPALTPNRGRGNLPTLLGLARQPLLWPQLAIYAYVKGVAKCLAYWRSRFRGGGVKWERDDTSRTVPLDLSLNSATPHAPAPAAGDR